MKNTTTYLENKKARLRFTVLESFQAGIELSGAEVKSLRNKLGKLDGSRVIVRAGEAFVVGMSIPPYQIANTPESYDPDRTRKLLLSKKEIAELAETETRKGLTIVPLEVYNVGRFIKVRVAIVKGKNKTDRREELRRSDANREIERALRRK